jgi:ABC-2 type transport system permease protein
VCADWSYKEAEVSAATPFASALGWARATWGLYRRLIAVQIRAQLEYRVSFVMNQIATSLATAGGFITIALILQRFEGIGGWSMGEIAFLYGMMDAAFGTTELFFAGFDPDRFAPMVQRGQLDQLLLRPVYVTLQVLGSEFALRRLGRIAQGIVILCISLSLISIHWTAGKILYLPIVFGSIVFFFGGLYVIGSTSTFWTVQRVEVINIFTYGGSEMMSYPMHIYSQWMRRFFTYILPAIFLNYYPALYFLDKPDPLGMPAFAPFLAPLVGIGLLIASFGFWRFGLRHYAGTGT